MLSRQVPNGDAAGVGTPVQRHLLRPAPAHLDVKQEFPKQKDIKKQPVFTCLQNTDV